MTQIDASHMERSKQWLFKNHQWIRRGCLCETLISDSHSDEWCQMQSEAVCPSSLRQQKMQIVHAASGQPGYLELVWPRSRDRSLSAARSSLADMATCIMHVVSHNCAGPLRTGALLRTFQWLTSETQSPHCQQARTLRYHPQSR